MLTAFASLKPLLLKSKKKRAAFADSPIFALHYSFTVAALATAVLLACGKDWFGGSIRCAFNKPLFPQEFIDAFCWANSTYYHVEGGFGHQAFSQAAPFIRPGEFSEDHIRVIAYYQWVAYFLAFQALMFYSPRWFWKTYEDGLLETLVNGTTEGSAVYLRQNSRRNCRYMSAYFISEFLACLNLVSQIFLADCILDGQFLDLGPKAVTYALSGYQGQSPILKVFPRMTKCSFQVFGLNGNPDSVESICILPLNVVFDKIFLFFWFWYAILLILTAVLIVFRLLMICSPSCRLLLLKNRLSFVDLDVVSGVFEKMSLGDWFVVYAMVPHMGIGAASELLLEIFRLAQRSKKPVFPKENGEAVFECVKVDPEDMPRQ